jgi:phosphoribulokinase
VKGRRYPVIIGIIGDSGAGKTTFAAGLSRVLGVDRTLTICIDDYHRYSRRQRAAMSITPHDPACNYLDILEQHIYLLRSGQPILKPVYNHNGGILEAPEYVEPREFIVLEGLLGYATPHLRDAFDVKFYMEPQETLRLRWKFQRDTGQGGYTREQVMASLDRLNRDSQLHIHPQRSYADMIIGFYPPDNRPDEQGTGLSVRHILRPTLPYLDLGPVLEVGSDKGFVLELARDIDGRPVDVLHVLGGLANGGAEAMEDYLWSLIPACDGDRPLVGEFLDEGQTIRRSLPLALSQLLVTHYLLNTALGQHAT